MAMRMLGRACSRGSFRTPDDLSPQTADQQLLEVAATAQHTGPGTGPPHTHTHTTATTTSAPSHPTATTTTTTHTTVTAMASAGAAASAAAAALTFRSMSPVLFVHEITPRILAFWESRLGFKAVVKVAHPPDAKLEDGAPLGFVILSSGSTTVMYQTTAAADLDLPGKVAGPSSSQLYSRVEGLEALRTRLGIVVGDGTDGKAGGADDTAARAARAEEGWEVVVAARKTFYGADETWLRAPCGALVGLSQHPDASHGDDDGTSGGATGDGDGETAAKKRKAEGE